MEGKQDEKEDSSLSSSSSLPSPWKSFRTRRHSLRIGASSVAALAGLHPYRDLPEVALQLVYQDGYALMLQDAAALGISLVSQEQILQELAQKAGPQTVQALQAARQQPAQSIQQATKIKIKLNQVVAENKKLTVREQKILCEEGRSVVDTGFGTFHEQAALDRLQRQTGTEVYHRNEQVWEWEFQVSGADTVVPRGPAAPRQRKRKFGADQSSSATLPDPPIGAMPVAEALDNRDNMVSQRAQCTSVNIIHDGEGETGAGPSVGATNKEAEGVGFPRKATEPQQTTPQHGTESTDGATSNVRASISVIEPPFFSILGSVDGIREEVKHVGYKDDDSWEMERMVVEVKHRMRRIHVVPPLYEQVQAVVYALMYRTNATEIVQVLRTEEEERPVANTKTKKAKMDDPKHASAQTSLDSWIKNPKPKETTEGKDPKQQRQSSFTMTVNNVRLDDPVMRHRHSWVHIILPRLRSFVEAVYRIRSDDHKRYRFLLATSEDMGGSTLEAWELLHQECPWLRDCDTAYRLVEEDRNQNSTSLR